MDHTPIDLYASYVRAAEFFNALVDGKYGAESVRAIFRMKMLSQEEFPRWWAEVSRDLELQARWLERFEDPAGSHARSIERITKTLDQIRIRRVAA
jgi:hypothetical protein